MMKTGLRIAALFAVYSGIGYGADYAAALLAQEYVADDPVVQVHEAVQPEVDVVVDVQPEIVVDVRVRSSGSCAYRLDHELTIPASGLDRLNIDVGSGELRVEGRQDLGDVVVVGEACASVEAWLDELSLSTSDDGSGVVSLVAHYPENRRSNGGENTAKIDLTVLVPLDLAVDIEDSSGEIEVSGTGDLWIDDSSGSIEVYGINGNVRIDDSSGGVQVTDVSGDVEIGDGSGGLDIRDVRGSVLVRDGSGGIEITEVDQDVFIESDGSGGIDVSRIGGDFVVDRDGSGGISCSDVAGAVDIPDDQRRRRRRRPCR
jgi:hypothetical protein